MNSKRPKPPPGWRRHVWRLAAVWALTFAAYSNSFHAGLVFDNASVIGEDPRIRAVSSQNFASILQGRYWYGESPRGAAQYRPLTTFSYLVNYAMLGDGADPEGYHWLNLLLHLTNIALVYALALLIFGDAAPAWAMAAIWGLHPVLTESVTNIVGRADLLAAFGVLAGLLCHARAAGAGKRRIVWIAGLAAAQAIAIFSKENGIVLPALMLLYDVTRPPPKAWRRRLLDYAAVALPIAAFFYLRSGTGARMTYDLLENPLAGAGFWTARLTAVKVIGKFLWLFLWPAKLSADYSYNAVPLFGWKLTNWEDAKTIVALAVCAGAAILAVFLAVRRPRLRTPLFFFLNFFFIALAPTSNLIVLIGSIMAERFLYLPAVGLAGCAVAAAWALGYRKWLHPAFAIICLAFAARTYARNFDWQDERSLWASGAEACPQAARPHYNLGIQLSQIPDKLPDAIAEFEAAVSIEPDFAEAHGNLGIALAQMPGRLPEAIGEFQTAARLQPDNAAMHNNLGHALADSGRLEEAIAEYQTAVHLAPDYADAHLNLANALLRLPDHDADALAEYQAALRIRPDPRLQEMVDHLLGVH